MLAGGVKAFIALQEDLFISRLKNVSVDPPKGPRFIEDDSNVLELLEEV